MSRVIIATHGPISKALLDTSIMFCGINENVSAIALNTEDSVENFNQGLRDLIDENENTLILVDIPGGTPCNQAMLLQTTNTKIKIVSGVNLMMVIDCILKLPHETVESIVKSIVESGQESIKDIGMINSESELDSLLD